MLAQEEARRLNHNYIGAEQAEAYIALLTKGELVAAAQRPRSAEDPQLAAVTLSCAKPNAGRPKGGNPNLNCGLCIACLVRLGAFIAGNRRDETAYIIDVLTGDAKQTFLHHRRHDIAAWRYATEAGFDDIRVLASGLWPPTPTSTTYWRSATGG